MIDETNELYETNHNMELKIFWTQCISLFFLAVISSIILNIIKFDLVRLILEILLILITIIIFIISFKRKKLNPYRYVMLICSNLFIAFLAIILEDMSKITVFSYFSLNILFTVIIFDNIKRVVFVTIESILYGTIIAYLLSLESSNIFIYNMLIQIIVSTCTMSVCFLTILKMYKSNSESLKEINKTLKEYALKDSLTNLWNREYMNHILDRVIEQKDILSVVMLDIDHFKNINDTYGHPVGDKVLKKFAQILVRSIPKNASAIRYGGEEFLIILPGKNSDEAFEVADKIRKKVETDLNFKEITNKITISGGVREYNRMLTKTTLIDEADKNLYIAKETGRNKIIG